ncbi:MAG: non-canonical purine NTP pyrophosphatase, RdgB/HAM1 family [Elusimicrobia bacterium CG1_02_56_21]|nr:MAG: non-canonical purine NTP pyrophosphatase, RdgB/HAM1 family [Elusimicrobia bacterium CG1_02_56_21]
MANILVAATFNPHKIREILFILPQLPFTIKPLSRFPGAGPAEEDGATLEQNAVKKAGAAARFTGLWALADDTGLEVDALGGRPGVNSARYAGKEASAGENNARLLSELGDLPPEKRLARFVTVIALVSPSGEIKISKGSLEGRIITGTRGVNGFGYDSIFQVGAGPRTLAEYTDEEKNSVSHRAAALKALLPELMRLFSAP